MVQGLYFLHWKKQKMTEFKSHEDNTTDVASHEDNAVDIIPEQEKMVKHMQNITEQK